MRWPGRGELATRAVLGDRIGHEVWPPYACSAGESRRCGEVSCSGVAGSGDASTRGAADWTARGSYSGRRGDVSGFYCGRTRAARRLDEGAPAAAAGIRD